MAKVKNKKSKLADVYAKKRKQQLKKTMSPFEVHVNRDKRKVLGQKSKADRGLPGVSRSKAINKRKETLLQEYKVKDRDNILLDKRLHQRNPHMTDEDKALARFAKERIKAYKKKNIFNLNDDEILTHRGQAIMDIEKFDNPNSDEDEFSDGENQEGRLGKKFLEEAHFGGGLLSKPGAENSRKSVIEELIADSKRRKAERQKQKEQTQDLTEKLDTDWKDLLPLITSSHKATEKVEEKIVADDYDITLRRLKFEARGNPTDKLKSEAEIAEKERANLEKLEEERLERMKGFSADDLYKKHRSADDLDSGFMVETVNDEDDNENPNKDETKDSETEDESGEESGEAENEDEEEEENEDEKVDMEEEEVDDEDNGSEKENTEDEQEGENEEDEGEINTKTESKQNSDQNSDEESENENSESDDDLSDLKASESSSEDEESVIKLPTKTKTKSILKKSKSEETVSVKTKDLSISEGEKALEKARAKLPCTYKVPETFEALKKLLHGHDEYHQSVIIERIIKCNHWSSGVEGNREKLAGLFEHLLMYIDCFDLSNEDSIKKNFQILDRLCPHLYDLAHACAKNAKECFQGIIKAKHDEFEEKKKKYVGNNLLIFLKLVSLIFPTSDFRHPVVSPCIVFMSQILMRCSVKRKSHISKGLFICTLLLEYTTLSKRFAPSVINFLRGLIYLSMPKPLNNRLIKVIPPFKRDGEFSSLLQIDENMKNSKIDLDKAQMKVSDLIEDEIDNDFKIRVFATTINLIYQFKKQNEELEAAFAIFEPFLNMLKCDFIKKYPKVLRKKIKELIGELEEMKLKKLEFLKREKKRPKALRLYEPRIEKVYEGRRHKKMSQEKAEKEKMIHKLKKEMKGAIREVRRDSAFLAKLKIKEQIKSDEERKRKVREIYGDAAVQQSEFNKIKRKK